MSARAITTRQPNRTDTVSVLMHPGAPFLGPDLGNTYLLLLKQSLERQGVQVSPYSRQRAVRSDFDLVHIHWPCRFCQGPTLARQLLALGSGLACFAATAIRRKPIVWTVHNLGPHGPHNRLLCWLVRRLLARRVALLISLSEATRGELERARHPCRHHPQTVIPHGRYEPLADPTAGSNVRVELGLGEQSRLIAFVGSLQPYKGVDTLISAFRSWDDPHARLIIAGENRDPDYVETLTRLARPDGRISIEARPLPALRFEAIVRAAELVALPYRSTLNSGTALHVLSLGTRVLLPATNTFKELQATVGRGWVRTYEALTPEELSEASAGSPDSPPDLSSFDWDAIGAQTAASYRRVLQRPAA
jgi:beta-1,4-mannosyltransferase